MKIWRPHPEECGRCGGSTEIFTDASLPEGWGYDGDEMRCIEDDCGCPGYWVVCDEDDCYANWHDDPDCTCEWCRTHTD